ncbi:heparan-alpha-glucosaminide N-acetyltransferase domain-containing protein [Ferruginibacter paludis]|uniref:DUF1624 domain-containing protein n=1 Tax=Ferruginibacter paludis TaxID=1310417 RepID=UPI0025B4788C|nr:heparan-alpha-glucosaminide N-acetyltransferase domain-containing protein [Ferruginibacter paludis]MDN3657023.1 heparan-alpha-glucosaminide N-acetyltransferase domain-containing protein [Ferruginibacter paludis]
MQQPLAASQKRIDSIDVLRGIVMVIMTLDHTRDFFHVAANTGDPLAVPSASPILFFTRWITHFCAPTFVFLSGLSCYLQSFKKSKKELSSFLIKRGLWLIIAEAIILSFVFTLNPLYNIIFLEVIWAIGISMMILGLLIYLPFPVILTIGLVIVLGHNLLDIPEAAPGFKPSFLYSLLHRVGGVMPFAPGHILLVLYPFLPWTGLMILGYCTGTFFSSNYSADERKKILLRIGVFTILFFVLVRFVNVYGNPFQWSKQNTWLDTFLSFINLQKYPPSLLFMCVTVGPALIVLSYLEGIQNRFTSLVRIYGRVPFFYYVVHFFLAHVVAMIVFFARGHNMQDVAKAAQQVPLLFIVPGEGFSLPVVYLIWLAIVAIMYPLCKKYDRYKTSHKEKWWLSYL